MRILCTALLTLVIFALVGGLVLAADQEDPGHGATAEKPGGAELFVTVAATGLSMALAASMGALGQSKAIAASVESMARQPEAGGRIFVSMIIGLALIETLVIYTLVIAFMMLGKA
jgi:F-type H+-transporting ATPase subunit c